ncbi:MAG: hypothetical protein Q8K78_11425 [Planctomycetaceae bacterium]|nr:hypothetical protein [Planctomycetaceae bacterium]
MDSLDFLGGYVALPPRDLLTWEQDDIPSGPAAYIFIAKRSFLYPRGKSPVFYVGQSSSLRRRLYRHKMAIRRAGDERLLAVYRPITEYAASFGANVAVVPLKKNPREVEFKLLAAFMDEFHGLPVANSAVNWRNVREHLNNPGEL